MGDKKLFESWCLVFHNFSRERQLIDRYGIWDMAVWFLLAIKSLNSFHTVSYRNKSTVSKRHKQSTYKQSSLLHSNLEFEAVGFSLQIRKKMVSVTLEVPHYVYAGHLIGAKGKNIRMIQDHYHGVKINYQPNEMRYVGSFESLQEQPSPSDGWMIAPSKLSIGCLATTTFLHSRNFLVLFRP